MGFLEDKQNARPYVKFKHWSVYHHHHLYCSSFYAKLGLDARPKVDNLIIIIIIIKSLTHFIYFILSIFTNNYYNNERTCIYCNIQEQWIIISMMLEGHSREDTNASPFHKFVNNFSEKNKIRITYTIMHTVIM